MTKAKETPDSSIPDPNQDRIIVQGIQLAWQAQVGTCTFQGLPVAMMWVDSTLAGLMSGVAAMVGPERFSLALQSEGRKSVEADWLLISRYPNFSAGVKAIAVVAAVAGWGEWQFIGDDPGERECRFRAYNSWEGLYQKKLGICWGSAMLAGKFAGYCSKRFATNCWATQTAFIAKGDPCDEFIVAPSPRIMEDEIARLLSTDLATRADLAVSLKRLREVQAQLLVNQETLEQQVRQRTAELAASRDQLQAVNDRLRTEMTGHKQTAEALKQSEQRLRAIIELAPISMAVVGMDGTIEYINRKAVETFGYRHEDIPTMDRWWVQAYPDPAYRNEVKQRWMGLVTSAIAEGRDIVRDSYHVICKDGTEKTIAVFGVPVADKVFVMFDDITIQALREELLRRSHAELEKRVQERTTELADRNRLLQAEIVERMHAENQLVHANLALERTMSQLRKLGAKLARVEVQERKRMAQLLLNVVKYSGVSAAEVRIAVLPDAKIQVVVADAGRGFDPTAASRHDDTESGFGLLAIRERFDALGGHLAIESEPGHGCRVTLTVPVTPSPSAFNELPDDDGPQEPAVTVGAADQQAPTAAATRIRVLLADDHMMLRQGLIELLSQDPCIAVVGEAADGEVAVEQARSLRPDVILMDIGMPRMDGFEATRAIHAEFPGIIIIGLSMHAESDRGDEMRQAGASAYVSKSEASEVLVATIHACFDR